MCTAVCTLKQQTSCNLVKEREMIRRFYHKTLAVQVELLIQHIHSMWLNNKTFAILCILCDVFGWVVATAFE